MADGSEPEAVSSTRKENTKIRVLQHDLEDDLGDEDLFSFLDFPEEVESAIAEVRRGTIWRAIESIFRP